MENKNKQTAVEWLIEQIEGDDSKIARVIGLKKYNSLIKKAKEIEKQQMKDAYLREIKNYDPTFKSE